MKTTFSDYTLQVLREAGWYPERAIDISGYETYLTSIGYALTDPIRDFFKEFVGLKLRSSRTFCFYEENQPETLEYLYVFDPIPSADRMFGSCWLEGHEEILQGEKLVVIGDQHDMTFFMSHSGKVYGGFDQYFCLLGNNAHEAIEEFCTWKNGPVVLVE